MSKAILVTGAAGGVGSELVRRAAARNDLVFACDLDVTTMAEFNELATVRLLAMDVADTLSVESAFTQVDEALAGKRLDAVIHCAAVAPFGPVETTDPEEFLRIQNINAVGSQRIARCAIPRLRGHDGRLVLISSLWGRTGGPLLSAYSASKHVVGALGDAIRRETVGQNLVVSVVELGVVRTQMFAGQEQQREVAAAAMGDVEKSLYLPLIDKYLDVVKQAEGTSISATEAAIGIEKAINTTRPKERYKVGIDAKLIAILSRILPFGALDRLFKLAFS